MASRSRLSTSHSARRRRRRNAPLEHIRWFLVMWAALLSLLAFVAFFVTKDIRMVLGGTFAGGALLLVYRYYFPRRQAMKRVTRKSEDRTS